ncbi:MAG: hypothetical protein WCB31_12270 [Nitrososphaeraceae archaeon]
MSNSQEDYLSILKRIKEKEDQVQVEIEKHRQSIEKDIKNLQEELENVISETKIEGKKMVEESVKKAKVEASKEAEQIIGDAEIKSKSISFNSNKQNMKNIIEILLSKM